MNTFDYLIVGQGIAGTLLAWNLKKRGHTVLIMDAGHQNSSSNVAAGIVNPITGKNFVCSWRVDEFLPAALETYKEMSAELGEPVYAMSNIIRAIDDALGENNWLARTADPRVSAYMLPCADASSFEGKVRPAFSYAELTGTFHVYMPLILQSYRDRWKVEGCLLEQSFDHDALVAEADHFEYNAFSFRNIVFCEGFQVTNNPFFPEYPMVPSKGQAFLVRIPNAGFTKMYKDQIFLVHQYDDVYWAGGGYEKRASDTGPTQEGYRLLKGQLDQILMIPYEIIDHKAAIRPTMQQRRPIVQAHDIHKGMYIFNGLGTKGGSMAPLIARSMAEALDEGFVGILTF